MAREHALALSFLASFQTTSSRGLHVLKESPDHHDADLVLKIYDLRRETVMRESRTAINAKFWPRTSDEAIAVTASEHPLNLAPDFRLLGDGLWHGATRDHQPGFSGGE
jgi:hypothetical protein